MVPAGMPFITFDLIKHLHLGFTIDNESYEVSLFADDVILMLTNPTSSLGEVYSILQWFSKVPCYKVNKTKLNILDLNLDGINRSILQQQFPFAWADSNISYLGIQLTKSANRIFKANYISFLTKMQQDLFTLQKLEFSWFGRLAAFKMNIFPQLLYLFRYTNSYSYSAVILQVTTIHP